MPRGWTTFHLPGILNWVAVSDRKRWGSMKWGDINGFFELKFDENRGRKEEEISLFHV